MKKEADREGKERLQDLIWGLSFAFFFSSLWSLSAFIISLFPVYYLIQREEEKLIRKYGEEYKQYREQVPMFLPKIKRKRKEVKI